MVRCDRIYLYFPPDLQPFWSRGTVAKNELGMVSTGSGVDWQVLVVTITPKIAQTPKYKTFWAWGNLATWSVIVALIVAGILEIAGTGSTFIVGYYVISALLLIGGVFQTIKSA